MTDEPRDAPTNEPTAPIREHRIEVPGTPDEVWHAIATGPGHAAWLFPADIDPGEGGGMVIHREPYGADAHPAVTAWEPPHRFAYTEPIGPEAEPLTTEFLVESKHAGHCVVRVVSGLHDGGEGWEGLLDAASEGWWMALRMLRAYLTHFLGRRASSLDVLVDLGRPAAERARICAALTDRLGLSGSVAGTAFRTPAGVPDLAGTVEHVSEGYVLLRAARPYPGLYAVSCFPMGHGAPLSVNLLARLYGAPSANARREQQKWQTWLADLRRSWEQ